VTEIVWRASSLADRAWKSRRVYPRRIDDTYESDMGFFFGIEVVFVVLKSVLCFCKGRFGEGGRRLLVGCWAITDG